MRVLCEERVEFEGRNRRLWPLIVRLKPLGPKSKRSGWLVEPFFYPDIFVPNIFVSELVRMSVRMCVGLFFVCQCADLT